MRATGPRIRSLGIRRRYCTTLGGKREPEWIEITFRNEASNSTDHCGLKRSAFQNDIRYSSPLWWIPLLINAIEQADLRDNLRANEVRAGELGLLHNRGVRRFGMIVDVENQRMLSETPRAAVVEAPKGDSFN